MPAVPPVLLIPGAGARGDGFYPGLPESLAAEPGCRTVNVDHAVPLAQAATHLHELIAEVGPVVVVGQSLGAAIALLLARDHPADVAGLVLLDPTPINDAVLCRRVERAVRSVAAMARIPVVHRGLLAWGLRSTARQARGLRPDCAAAQIRIAAEADLVQLGREVTGLTAVAAGFDMSQVPRVPAVVVTAERPPKATTRVAHQRIADALGAPLQCWPGSTHAVHLTHPEDTVAVVRDVLSRV